MEETNAVGSKAEAKKKDVTLLVNAKPMTDVSHQKLWCACRYGCVLLSNVFTSEKVDEQGPF